jgi:ribosomal protein S5
MAEKTIVDKAGETVGVGIAMASDVAGAIKTAFGAAVTTVTEVLSSSGLAPTISDIQSFLRFATTRTLKKSSGRRRHSVWFCEETLGMAANKLELIA